MAPPLIGGDIKRWCCLTSVSVAYVGPKSRTERPRKIKIGTEVAHGRHTWLGHHFQGQGHQAALLIAVLTRQAAAAVGVGTYWPYETTATLRSARRREALRRPHGGGAAAYRTWRPPAYSLLMLPSRLKWRAYRIKKPSIYRSVHINQDPTAVVAAADDDDYDDDDNGDRVSSQFSFAIICYNLKKIIPSLHASVKYDV